MKRNEINKVTGNLRETLPGKYAGLKRRWKHRFMSTMIKRKLEAKGFTNYEQIKEACPKGVLLAYFIYELIT